VRLVANGRAMLLDLGAAVAAGSHASVFTPAFAAPEVRAGAAPSRASDLYSLGATLAACAAKLPPSLEDLVARLRAEHPADRPLSALDVVAVLGRSRTAIAWEGASRGTHVREDLLRRALAAKGSVVYVTGAGGSGKSHLVRELVTRAL